MNRSILFRSTAIAEAAFTDELTKLVGHLAERLSGTDDGKPKVFRDSAVENLRDFFTRFRSLLVGSDEQLEAVVRRAETLLGGTAARDLRDRPAARSRIAAGLADVRVALDPLLAERPRRRVLRTPR